MWKRKKKPEEPKEDPIKPLFDDDGGNPLFDEWSQYKVVDAGTGIEYLDMSMEDFEISEMNKSKTKRDEDEDEDKIFGNSYNSGGVHMSRLPEIKVRADYAGRLDCYRGDTTSHVRMEMSRRCDEIFSQSQWAKLSDPESVDPKKVVGFKLPKILIPYVFNELYVGLDDGYSSTTDRFIVIAEFLEHLHVSYDKVYASIPVKIKERLLQELDEANGNITGKRIVRLF